MLKGVISVLYVIFTPFLIENTLYQTNNIQINNDIKNIVYIIGIKRYTKNTMKKLYIIYCSNKII